MSEITFSHLSRHLAELAISSLDPAEHAILKRVIEQLFLDLDKGHSCTEISALAQLLLVTKKNLLEILAKSNLTGVANKLEIALDPKPLTLLKNKSVELLYISKYLAYELNIAHKIAKLNIKLNIQNDKFKQALRYFEIISKEHNLPNQEQLGAIINSANHKLSIITGGPGTGKTTTVALLLWLLDSIYDDKMNIKICAPTGKAANRVKESISNSLIYFRKKKLKLDYGLFERILNDSMNFSTIHKILGYRYNSIYFKHDEENALDIDILIIDESSMIGLPLFSKLLSAINVDKVKHIIFLGDKNQLSSVEEGYVFASIVNVGQKLTDWGKSLAYDLFSEPESGNLSQLIVSNRNSGDVGKLADAILNQNNLAVFQLLSFSSHVTLKPLRLVQLFRDLLFDEISSSLKEYLFYARDFDININVSQLFAKLNTSAILCLTNSGIFGVQNLNLQIEKKIRQILSTTDTWYNGRPIMILENDYSLGLYNGDIGICMIRNGKAIILFDGKHEFIPEILPKHQLAYAITIHKSQGSEYNHVNIILPDLGTEKEELLSRELVYTAVTRAKLSVTFYTARETVEKAILRQTNRISGMEYLLS